MEKNKERFDKIIASQFNISRKEARITIRQGKGSVDGQVLKDPSALISPETQKIEYEDRVLQYKKYIYLLMNKPKGVISAGNDKNCKTVIDIVPEKFSRNGLFPVGRLDKNTTGLLVITDDGDFAHKAISPNKNIFKTYVAELDGAVTEDMVEAFEKGIILADGTVCKKAFLKPISENKAEIKICEGKYHQIKRMFGTVGLGVNELSRIAMGELFLPRDMAEGECIELSNKQIALIFDKKDEF